jgi:hypothetical protein
MGHIKKGMILKQIDLKTLAAGRFRLTFDEAASIEPGGKKDPWYQVIPCRYGQIYPFSDSLLAIHSKGSGIRRRLQAIEGLTVLNWSDDGEAIFLFPQERFDRVAEIVKPRRKRHLSEANKKKLVEAGSRALKLCRKANTKCPKTAQGRAIAREVVSEVGQSR